MASRKYDVNATHTEGISDLLRSHHPSPQGAGNKIDSLLPRLHTLLKQAPPASPELRQLLHLIEDRYLKQVPRSRPLESALDAITYYGDNELAVDVLRKKYLAPGEKGPLHLWDRVARAIASIEKDPAYWYEKFLSILVDFKFVPGGRVMHGAGREDARRRPTLSNCFLAGTDVITDLGILPIEDVTIGDRVLTHTGKYQRVDNVLVREVDELIYTLTVAYNHSPLHCTGNHELLVLTKEDGQWVERWKAAETVQIGEYLKVADISMDTSVPVPQVLDLLEYLPGEEVENEGEYIYQRTHFIGGHGAHGYRDTGKVYRYIPVDYRFNKWLGYFYAEGGLLQVNGKNKCIYFTFHQEELGYVDEVMALTEELFGVIPTYNERNGQEGKWCRIYIHNKLLADFLSVFIRSRYNHNKTLPPWFLSQSKEHLKRFISGLFRGDGFPYTQSKTGALGIRLIMANPELMKQVYLILRKLNIVASFDPDYDNGPCQRHPTALINVATVYYANILMQWMADYYEAEAELKNFDFVHHYRVHNGALYFRVRSIQSTQMRTLVYNLSIAEDNTYTANFQVVHNCYVIPIEEDSLEGIYQCLAESAMVYRTGGGVGCIRKDALVLTQAGVQKIQEVQAGDHVLSFNMVSGKFEWKPVEKVHEFLVENQDNIKIVFNDHSYIITSFWHPTLVYNRGDFGYKRADQLQVGDLTLTPKREFWYASSYHDPDLGWALGAYLGDGCAYLSHKRVYQKDYKGLGKQRFAYRLKFAGDSREVIERFVEIINTYCGLHVQPHQRKRSDYQSPVYEVSTNAYSLHKFLELTDWQTGRKCYTLHIPQRIWRASEETALAFIAGLIDTDGVVDNRRGRITYSSVSRTMVEELQALISLLGGQTLVHGKKREGTVTSSGISNRKDVYELSLYADDIILKILPYLRHSEKRRRLERILDKVYLKGRIYTLPDDCVTFILRFPATRVLGINSSALSALRHGRRTLSSRLFTRMMENIIQHEETTPTDRHLARFYLNMIPQLREIKSLQRGIEDTTEFYDFTIPDNNNYVAGFGNFYVVHNTDLSILRPEGAPVNATIDKSPGATAFMNLFSESTNTVSQAGRRGALMLTLRVDHPDIEKFIHIKNDPLRMKVQYANISVLLTHLFMEKVAAEHDPTRQQEICFELEDEQGNRQNVFARPDEEIEYEGKIWTAEALYRHLRTNKPSTKSDKSESSPAKTKGGAHGSGSGLSV